MKMKHCRLILGYLINKLRDATESIYCELDSTIYFWVKSKEGRRYKIALLRGYSFSDKDRITEKIRLEATGRGFAKPNDDVSRLICSRFTYEEIGIMGLLGIVVMCEPAKEHLPGVARYSDGSNGELKYKDYYDGNNNNLGHHIWDRNLMFAFVASGR
jgi:hypothetical protein